LRASGLNPEAELICENISDLIGCLILIELYLASRRINHELTNNTVGICENILRETTHAVHMKYAGDSIEGCAISKQNIYCKKAQGAAQPHDLYDINLKK
jgi:hypothetical protein